MIEVNGKCYVDVKFEGFKGLTLMNFQNLIIKEVSGMILPIFELDLIQKDYGMLKNLRVMNLPITISYGDSMKSIRTYKFLLFNYNYIPQPDGDMILRLNGTIDIKEFTNTPRIRSVKGTSDKAIALITSLKPVINYVGKDSQVWIQHNNSDKNFVERVLDHSYIDNDDVVLGSITIDKDLVISSVKTKFKTTPKIKFKQSPLNTEPDTVRFDSMKVESDSALWSSYMSEGRALPVFRVEERAIDLLVANSSNSIINNKPTNLVGKNINYPIIIDTGNCHEFYYETMMDNLNTLSIFSRNLVYITSSKFLNNSKLMLNDLVDLIPDLPNLSKLADPMSGRYLMTEKITAISQKGLVQRFRINRDYNLR